MSRNNKTVIEESIKIAVPMFRTYVKVEIRDEEDILDSHNRIARKFGEEGDEERFNARGRAYDIFINDEGFREANILIDNEKVSHGVIAHEVYHSVNFILKYVDIPFTPVTEEVYTCLTEYITEMIYRSLSEEEVALLKTN